MIIQAKELFFERINHLYQRKIPFFFLTDYALRQMEVTPLAALSAENLQDKPVLFQTPGGKGPARPLPGPLPPVSPSLEWHKQPVSFGIYEKAFQAVQKQIQLGNSYLVNLTFSTPVTTTASLMELYNLGAGQYKLYYRDRFVHFSPEPFIRIQGEMIHSYPMKGTIDADLPEAAQAIIENKKEQAEQFTIVDLIRNDLSQVATRVQVTDFRYLEKLTTNQKNLYAVSSKISGELRPFYKDRPGDILAAMLPAGSISGAPKTETLGIIAAAETHDRGFYTGVWGVFDGTSIDSCVIIRYLENPGQAATRIPGKNNYMFKSGGGITAMSDARTEYQEMIDKVYIPLSYVSLS